MKIVKVEAIPVSTPMKKPFYMPGTKITHIHSLLLKLTTDSGLVGVGDSGDTSTWYRGETPVSMQEMIIDHIAPQFLLGADPLAIEKIVEQMDTFVRDNNQAKGTVDFALHDLAGKALNVPVYQLLGGKSADYSVQGWVCSAGPVEQVVAEAVRAHAEGFALVKLKSDANGFWNYDQALKAMRRLDQFGMECVEQPVPHWDIEGMARLRGKIGTPVFADESAQELHHIREIIERRAADGLFIKLQKAGGLLKAQRWLTMARLADLAVMSGCVIGSGLEASPSAHLTVDIAVNPPVFSGGKLYPNEGPGFGIELNEEFIAGHLTPGKRSREITVADLG